MINMAGFRKQLQRIGRDEQGLTLVELIIGSLVSAMFLSLLAVLFANGLGTQAQTMARDVSTGEANATAMQLNRAIRSSNAVYLFPTFINANGLPQTQLNLTRVVRHGDNIPTMRINDFYCEVWIWEDLANGQTELSRTWYRNYTSGRPIGGVRVIGSWETAHSSGMHVRSSQNLSGYIPRYSMLEYEVGATVDDQFTPVHGGSFPQEITPVIGYANPCQSTGTWPPGT